MNNTEKILLEAMRNMFLSNPNNLGIVKTDREEVSHRFEFNHNAIDASFALKAADSPYMESLSMAFSDIHSYKYLEDPTFQIAMTKRLSAIGIPAEERNNAVKYLEELKEEYLTKKAPEEKEYGWHPNLDEIMDTTRNANDRNHKIETPFTGGGPAPDKNEIK